MWEIENNPDILNLDKDPEAESFLCEWYDIEKPSVKISETNTDGIAEKSIDAENPEINDVEGIMNLGENEWNELFTIEEQEVHNVSTINSSLDLINMSPARNNTPDLRKTAIIREAIPISPTKIKICQTSVPVISEITDELYLSALHSNCKVALERLSIIQINRLIQSNFSVGLLEDSYSKKAKKFCAANIVKPITCQKEPPVEIKPKKIINTSSEIEKIVSKVQILPEQRKPINIVKGGGLSTINKNSVSRIIDAISIDSDDNQSCIIVSSPKTKGELKRKQEKIENDLKVLPTIKLKLVRPNEETDKNDKLINSDGKKVNCKPKFKDRKIIKSDWSNKNTNGKPITFDNFFNKKFSILGSGLKIGKKASTLESGNFTKIEDDEKDQWSSLKDSSNNNHKVIENTNDDDNEENLWPKMKDQDEFDISGKSGNYEKSDDYGDFAADDDDDDCQWPVAKDEGGNFKNEKHSTVQNELDDEELDSAQKWYSNNEEINDESTKTNHKDPWSSYLSKNKNVNQVEDETGDDIMKSGDLTEFAEIDDDLIDVIVKGEPVNPPKKSVGNVWSQIQEFQNQFENNGGIGGDDYIEEMEDIGITNDVDETIKTMSYIKDAKWLNSRNEDFLDSYQSPTDYGKNMDSIDSESHDKWYGQGKTRSPPERIPSLMEIDTSLTYKGFKNVEKTAAPESWVDSGPPFKTYRGSVSFNNRTRQHHLPNNSRSNYISPNKKPQSFQNIPLDQLFPPFKAEYFKNNKSANNTFNDSSENSPNWTDKGTKINHPFVTSNCNQMDQRSFNKPPPLSIDPYCNGAALNKTKGMPYGPSFPYYGDPCNPYHKESFTKGFPVSGSYNYYGNPFSKINSYPYYPPKMTAVPITPESPDPYTDEIDALSNSKPASNTNQTKSLPKSNSDISVNNKKLSMNSLPPHPPSLYASNYHPYMTENGQYMSYDDMYAYYYPFYGPTYGPTYTNPNQFYSYTQHDTSSYTPASPDPDEMCPTEKPNT